MTYYICHTQVQAFPYTSQSALDMSYYEIVLHIFCIEVPVIKKNIAMCFVLMFSNIIINILTNTDTACKIIYSITGIIYLFCYYNSKINNFIMINNYIYISYN